jgi:hypothetical protein
MLADVADHSGGSRLNFLKATLKVIFSMIADRMLEPVPVYTTPVKFFRNVLGISYQFGIRLAKMGVLKPDATLDDGRPIYLLEQNSIRQAQERIAVYRRNAVRAEHNVPLCHTHAVSV